MIYPDGKECLFVPMDGTVMTGYNGSEYTYRCRDCGWFDVNRVGPFHWELDSNRIAHICIGPDPYALTVFSLISIGVPISVNTDPSPGSIVRTNERIDFGSIKKTCECGAYKVKSTKHYSWCCLYSEETI